MAEKKITSKKLKKHDFVEVEYTGRLEDNTVFDTTDEKTAKEAGIHREGAKFGAVTICLGENHILAAIENEMIGKEPGNVKLTLQPEQGFGKKNAKLLKLLPMKVFRKEQINPFPGLEVNVDNMFGIVRSVSGGRVIVDFNHPLSGRVVKYEVKVNKVITDPLEKAKSLLKNELQMVDTKLEVKNKTLIIEENIPDSALDAVKKRVLELIPELKDVVKKEATKKESKK